MEFEEAVIKNNWLDKLSIAITSLCALHCILLPVLLPILPLLGLSIFSDHEFEHYLLMITFVLGFIALFSGFHRYHKKLYPLYTLAIGTLVYGNRHSLGEDAEPYILTLGAIFIIGAHIMNIRLCKSCKGCDDKPKEVLTTNSESADAKS